MKRRKPHTRSAAAAPRATAHLTIGQQAALEVADEAEHTIGPHREKLIRKAVHFSRHSKSSG
jgi:hypothetical protein